MCALKVYIDLGWHVYLPLLPSLDVANFENVSTLTLSRMNWIGLLTRSSKIEFCNGWFCSVPISSIGGFTKYVIICYRHVDIPIHSRNEILKLCGSNTQFIGCPVC